MIHSYRLPAFRGDTVRSQNSRKSSYSTIVPPSPPTADSPVASANLPEDPPFTPPGVPLPAFRNDVRPGERPKSSFVQSPIRRQSSMPPDRPQSSYVPSPGSRQNSQFARPSTFPTNDGDRPRPSIASSMTLPQESPFEPQVAFINEEQPGDYHKPLLIPSAVFSDDNSLCVPPSPAFVSHIQPGDRPRSYVPSTMPPVSPEDELFAPPAATFRGMDRPRSMA